MYYETVQTLAHAVLAYIKKHALLAPGDRLGVAVSGGADSVALLRLLLELRRELGIVLSVIHFNHRLRTIDSDEDERFVQELSARFKLPFLRESGDVSSHAAKQKISVETAAREMRYAYFRALLADGRLDRIATAHTLDDQAETVLLKIVRGAGTRGLAGTYPELKTAGPSATTHASIVRPLLSTARKDLEAYLKELNQSWREDKSNRDLRHARNRVRHGILPRLERNLNPDVRHTLAEAAEIARAEQNYWDAEVGKVLPSVAQTSHENAVVKLAVLEHLPLALRRRALRKVADSLGLKLEFRHLESILEMCCADPRSVASVMLPSGWMARRHKDELYFEPQSEASDLGSDYEYLLPIPGSVVVPELCSTFEAVLVSGDQSHAYNPEHAIWALGLGKQVQIRNWRAGDRFWPAHTKSSKKIKELLYDRHVSGAQRKLWPVIVCGDEVVWMRGFPSPARLHPAGDTQAVIIREVPFKN